MRWRAGALQDLIPPVVLNKASTAYLHSKSEARGAVFLDSRLDLQCSVPQSSQGYRQVIDRLQTVSITVYRQTDRHPRCTTSSTSTLPSPTALQRMLLMDPSLALGDTQLATYFCSLFTSTQYAILTLTHIISYHIWS